MLAHEGLLTPLATALLHTAEDDDDLADSAKIKIVQILLAFAQSDYKVKEALATRPVITSHLICLHILAPDLKALAELVKVLDLLEEDTLASLLKTVKGLSMSPKALDVLQNANVIEVLVRILKDHLRGPMSTEISNPIVNALYNLCRLSKSRQEEAASAGAIPALIDLSTSNSPLKQFALPILCDFAQTSKACRKLLWQNDGLQFYLGLLKDPFWSVSALESISAWLVCCHLLCTLLIYYIIG